MRRNRTCARSVRTDSNDAFARVTPDVARRGGLPRAVRQASRPLRRASALRTSRSASRLASGHRAAFVAWYGPVFWPYAYSDVFGHVTAGGLR